MNAISRDELAALISEQAGPCVSIYLPTHRTGVEYQQDRIRLRTALRQAEVRLRAEGLRIPEVHKLLAPVQTLLTDSWFWRHCRQGLAIFASSRLFRPYCLPRPTEEQLVVADRFDLTPLLPLLTGAGQFYLLALSQNAVRLFLGTRDGLEELPFEHGPHCLAEAFANDVEVRRELQVRSATAGGQGGGSAIYYRTGDMAQHAKDRLLQYCRSIDRGLGEELANGHRPLVLAGVDYLLALFREVSHYPELAAGEVPGNPDRVSPQAMHARAWPLAQSYFRERQAEAVAIFQRLTGSSRASTDFDEIAVAASQGRVETLFMTLVKEPMSSLDRRTAPDHAQAARQGDDECRLGHVAIHTILHGGRVYALAPGEMATAGRLAAVFRT